MTGPPPDTDRVRAGVREVWRGELRIRGLDRADFLPPNLLGAPPPSSAAWTCDDFAAEAAGLLHGSAISGGRVVLSGRPGSGRTVLAMLGTLGLAEHYAVVPLLVSLTSWRRPGDFGRWLDHRLARTYPGCWRPGQPARLRAGPFLPVLDGLDEVHPALRAGVRDEIDRFFAPAAPLIVVTGACGPAVPGRQLALTDAPPARVAAFLRSLWHYHPADPDFAALAARLDGDLAELLGRPLYLDLTVAAMRARLLTPGDLATRVERDGPDGGRELLVELTVRAALQGPGVTASLRARRWVGELARRDRDAEESPWTVAALRGRLPWRLRDFRADLHRCGVLRREGDHYRFRSRELRDQLTGDP